MSDGFITVGQCIDGLPVGRFSWELLFCGFLAWLMLGALNESAALSFWTEPAVAFGPLSKISAASVCGNIIAIAVGTCAADKYGRVGVIRPALLLTACFGLMFQTAETLEQVMIVRFMLGMLSGVLLAVIPPLLAELLPAQNRGFFLTIWCCGWPLGAILCLIINSLSFEQSWREFNGGLLLPALILYVCVRAEMLPESPRFLYLVGRRDEGYRALVDMYDKEHLSLPWSPDHISVTTSAPQAGGGPAAGTGSEVPEPLMPTSKRAAQSNSVVAVWLLLAVFFITLAAQFLLVWLPTASPRLRVERLPTALLGGPHEALSYNTISRAALASISALLRREGEPLRSGLGIVMLSQAYTIECMCIIMCAYLATWLRRRQLVRWAPPCAAIGAVLAVVCACGSDAMPLIFLGPALGLTMAAEACCLNFLLVFATEHFATSQRVAACGAMALAGQLASLAAPGLAALAVERAPLVAVVTSLCAAYLVAWFATMRLPLPASRERPLQDIDETRFGKDSQVRLPKREFMNYQTL